MSISQNNTTSKSPQERFAERIDLIRELASVGRSAGLTEHSSEAEREAGAAEIVSALSEISETSGVSKVDDGFMKSAFEHFWNVQGITDSEFAEAELVGGWLEKHGKTTKLREAYLHRLKAAEKDILAEMHGVQTRDETAFLEMTVTGLIDVVRGVNPRLINEKLKFGYAPFYGAFYEFDSTRESIKMRIEEIVELCTIARRKGLLAIEDTATKIEDVFLKTAAFLILDGNNRFDVRDILELRIRSEEICGKSRNETAILRLTAEGILLISEGTHPDIIREKLNEEFTK